MKSNPALAVAVSIAVLFCIGLIYLNIRLVETTRQLNALRATSAAEEAHMVLIQGSIDAFKRDLKQYDEVVGSHGTLQMLAKRIDGGEMDLSLKSLKRSEEHTSELQSLRHLVCRLLLEKKKKKNEPENMNNRGAIDPYPTHHLYRL